MKRRILTNLYGVSRSRPNRKPIREWLEDEIKATEREIIAARNRPDGRKPYGQYLIEKAEKKLERLREKLRSVEEQAESNSAKLD